MRILSNGVDGESGALLLQDLDSQAFAEMMRSAPSDREVDNAVRLRQQQAEPAAGVAYGTNTDNLASAGWAVVLPSGISPAVVEELKPLIERRRREAGDRFTSISDSDEHAYRGESKTEFLTAVGAPPAGRVEPNRFPYYVLLVGGPELIPFQFQREMSIQHAVGRVCFDDPREYGRYAEAVLAAEAVDEPAVRTLRLLAATHRGDDATALSEQRLAGPLLAAAHDWLGPEGVREALGARATRAEFLDAFSDESSVVFTAGHGVGFPAGDQRQTTLQGALLTSSWESVDAPMERSHYVAGEDLVDATPAGKIVFNFACFSAGTPALDSFAQLDRRPSRVSDAPFVAALPKALLGHRRGGALACVGHVDRAWGFSFLGDDLGDQTVAYRDLLHMVLDGHRIGFALEAFAALYAENSAIYLESVSNWRDGLRPDESKLVARWMAAADAGGFVVTGDPAVRLGGGLLR